MVAAFSLPGAAAAQRLELVSAFPPGFVFNREITDPFVAAVERGSNGRIDIRVHGPEVAPAFDQLESTQAGVFDLLVTTAAYHSGSIVEGLAIDAVRADPKARRKSGFFDAVAAHYRARGLKLLVAAPTGSKGFHFLTRKPLKSGAGLQGLKIRATQPYHHMIRTLGGSPVVLDAGNVYVAMQRGVIDGAAWGITGAYDLKWHEVICCMTRPLFGQVNILILMNWNTWESLTPAQKRLLDETARSIEDSAPQRFDMLAETEFAALKAEGVTISSFDSSAASRLDKLWADGVWRIVRQRSPMEAAALRKFAQEAGLDSKRSGASRR